MAAPMNSVLCFTTTATIVLIVHLLFLPFTATCLTQPPSLSPSNSEDPSKVLLSEEKTRLGSRPPSCHNKCNACHPCRAVQVPSLPKHVGNDQSSGATIDPATDEFFYLESSSRSGCNNRYSNYKPLGWKCRCRNHFYNP